MEHSKNTEEMFACEGNRHYDWCDSIQFECWNGGGGAGAGTAVDDGAA